MKYVVLNTREISSRGKGYSERLVIYSDRLKVRHDFKSIAYSCFCQSWLACHEVRQSYFFIHHFPYIISHLTIMALSWPNSAALYIVESQLFPAKVFKIHSYYWSGTPKSINRALVAWSRLNYGHKMANELGLTPDLAISSRRRSSEGPCITACLLIESPDFSIIQDAGQQLNQPSDRVSNRVDNQFSFSAHAARLANYSIAWASVLACSWAINWRKFCSQRIITLN